VSKLNSAGSALVYFTYLGGSYSDSASAIAVDSSGNAYVAGTTLSGDFPTVNPIQGTLKSPHGDGFVTEFDAAGDALVYSTYLGGGGTVGEGDNANGIAVDSSGNAYVRHDLFHRLSDC